MELPITSTSTSLHYVLVAGVERDVRSGGGTSSKEARFWLLVVALLHPDLLDSLGHGFLLAAEPPLLVVLLEVGL